MTLVGGEAEPVGAGEAADVEPYHAKLGQGYRVLYMIREKEQFLTCVVETSASPQTGTPNFGCQVSVASEQHHLSLLSQKPANESTTIFNFHILLLFLNSAIHYKIF